jgi:hypothetical protein
MMKQKKQLNVDKYINVCSKEKRKERNQVEHFQ